MAKIVINPSHGGFNLSYEAVMRYAKLKGITLYAYPGVNGLYVRHEPDELGHQLIHYTTIDAGPNPEKLSDGAYFSPYHDIKRDDPALVQVVEELAERSNGKYSQLKVVEIPDDVKWVIQEYDGAEWIAEVHRTWS